MTLLLGGVALLALWWLGRNAAKLNPALTARLMRRVGSYAGIALAILFLARGRTDLAILFGAGGVWLMEGKAGLLARGRRLFGIGRQPNQTLVEATPDGGVARAGPYSGARLADMPLDALKRLLAACRASDPVGAGLLEAHLDGRRPGWRVDTEGDGDPRPRRPPDPGAMTEQQAHEILGLQRGATLEEVRAAHRALMKRLHPDQGGVGEGAARVNAARDRLVSRHR